MKHDDKPLISKPPYSAWDKSHVEANSLDLKNHVSQILLSVLCFAKWKKPIQTNLIYGCYGKHKDHIHHA